MGRTYEVMGVGLVAGLPHTVTLVVRCTALGPFRALSGGERSLFPVEV